MRRQQIIETVECDRCGNVTPEATSFEIEIGIARRPGGAVRRTVDVCPAHEPSMSELYEWLRQLGRPAAAPRDAGPVVVCPACGERFAKHYLGPHLAKAHGATAPQPHPPKCPDCTRGYASAAGLIAHRKAAHGYDHTAALAASVKPQPTLPTDR